MKTTYTVWGPVGGGCGHRHVSEAAAIRCLDRASAACAEQGGRSDRAIYRGDPRDGEVMYIIDDETLAPSEDDPWDGAR